MLARLTFYSNRDLASPALDLDVVLVVLFPDRQHLLTTTPPASPKVSVDDVSAMRAHGEMDRTGGTGGAKHVGMIYQRALNLSGKQHLERDHAFILASVTPV